MTAQLNEGRNSKGERWRERRLKQGWNRLDSEMFCPCVVGIEKKEGSAPQLLLESASAKTRSEGQGTVTSLGVGGADGPRKRHRLDTPEKLWG